MKRARRVTIVGLLILTIVFAWRGGIGREAARVAQADTNASPTVLGTGLGRFPVEDVYDWAEYADVVILGTITDEEELPLDEEVVENDEGYVGREVTIAVDDTVWIRDGLPGYFPDPLVIETMGWVMVDGDLSPFALTGGPRLEVGSQYLLPLVYGGGNDSESWFELAPDQSLPIDEVSGEISEDEIYGLPAEVLQEVEGGPPEDLAAALTFAELAPIRPSLSSPEDEETISEPSFTITGDGINEAWDYQVQYATDYGFTDLLCDSDWYGSGHYLESSWSLPGDIGYGAYCELPAAGTYYWRARMRDSSDLAPSDWTEPATFTWTE